MGFDVRIRALYFKIKVHFFTKFILNSSAHVYLLQIGLILIVIVNLFSMKFSIRRHSLLIKCVNKTIFIYVSYN